MAIRPDSDPKLASPRSGAPKGELEQYGVWVKAEPQDVVEEIAVPASGDFDFDLPGDTALPEESFLSEDEERLLGTFDSEIENTWGSSPTEESGILPDIEDMPPLEESLMASEPSPVLEELEDFESGGIDISLEDIQSANDIYRGVSPIHPGLEIDMESIQGLDSPNLGGDSLSEGIEDVSSEFLDMPEEAGQGNGVGAEFGMEMDDVTAEFLDSDESPSFPKEISREADFEPLDIDLQFDDADASLPPEAAGSMADFEEVSDFDDFLTEDESKPFEAAKPLTGDFDDLTALERELTAPDIGFEEPSLGASEAVEAKATAPIAPSKEGERRDLSTELLQKIAEELASIRGELVSLKTRIGEIAISGDSRAAKPVEAPVPEDEDSGPVGGFFDDEEDETIALTGDELDNILNTADFTEEMAETQQLHESEGQELPPGMPFPESSDLLNETLLPESGDYSPPSEAPAAEPAIEEVRLGEPTSIDEAFLEPAAPNPEDLDLFVEEGVVHMTSAPEDSSFLDGAGSLDLGMPMNDEPLVEPDLSDFDFETEDLDSRLEIDEELPLASLEPEIEDIALNIEAGPDYNADDSIVEAELVEPIAEIEETSYADINLHEEAQDLPTFSEPSDLEELEIPSSADAGPSTSQDQPSPTIEELSFDEVEDFAIPVEEEKKPEPEAAFEAPPAKAEAPKTEKANDSDRLKSEIKSVLSYLDKLLDSLPEEKIEEFARSKYFDTYKKLFEELGLV